MWQGGRTGPMQCSARSAAARPPPARPPARPAPHPTAAHLQHFPCYSLNTLLTSCTALCMPPHALALRRISLAFTLVSAVQVRHFMGASMLEPSLATAERRTAGVGEARERGGEGGIALGDGSPPAQTLHQVRPGSLSRCLLSSADARPAQQRACWVADGPAGGWAINAALSMHMQRVAKLRHIHAIY